METEEKKIRITIRLHLTEKGQRAHLLAGGDGCQVHEFQGSYGRAIAAELMEHATISPRGDVTVDGGWVDAMPDNFAGYVLTKKREERARAEAALLETWRRQLAGGGDYGEPSRGKIEGETAILSGAGFSRPLRLPLTPELATEIGEHEVAHQLWAEANRASEQRRKEREREEKAAREQKAAAKAAAEEAYQKQRDEWIRVYGSERLQKILALGLIEDSHNVYRDERLAKDYPGWQVDDATTEKEGEIRNPSLQALQLLEDTIKEFPDAYLVTVKSKDPDDYWREAVKVDDLPGIASPKVFYRLVE